MTSRLGTGKPRTFFTVSRSIYSKSKGCKSTLSNIYKIFWVTLFMQGSASFRINTVLHCKKRSVFPSLAGMSLTKLSLAGNNLISSTSTSTYAFFMKDYYACSLIHVRNCNNYCTRPFFPSLF